MAQKETDSKAILSLIFSILGLVGVCPLLGSILGIVFGAGEEDGVGKVGYILGWVGLLLVALPLLIIMLFVLFGAMAMPLAY